MPWQQIVITGGLTLLLCISHLLSPYIKRLHWLNTERLFSFAGGVAVGYVFLHMLPQLVESRDRIHDLLDNYTVMSPFKDLAVFGIALLGFEVYYVLERLSSKKGATLILQQEHAYRLNIALYFIYNFLITYTMKLLYDTGILYALLFTLAMGLHFILTDSRIRRYYHAEFTQHARYLLLFALVLGYVCSLWAGVNIYALALLNAFLSGAVLYTAFSEEIALNRESSMLFFFMGSAVMGILLALTLVH